MKPNLNALFNLAWLVALHGGAERFEEVVRLAIANTNEGPATTVVA